MRPDDLLDRFAIARTASTSVDSVRAEPRFAAVRLDPARAEPEPVRSPGATAQSKSAAGPLGSLLIHLLPLLMLVQWGRAPVDIPRPIPVQLVIEAPPPPLPPAPKEEKKLPPGRLASIEMGGKPAAEAEQAPPAPPTPAEVQLALPKPVPEPEPEPELAALPPEPKPAPPKRPAKQAAAVRLPNPSPSARHSKVPGPDATRDEYLAYCAALIRRYFDMLPASFLAGRSGLTVLSIVVLDDGTIARVAIARRSGYPDIDSRAEQMVAAVGRFPPLPQWIQGPSMVLEYDMPFRGGLLSE